MMRFSCIDDPKHPAGKAQWGTRKAAEAAAVAIGWPKNAASRECVMGFYVWVLMQPDCEILTREQYEALAHPQGDQDG